MANNYNIIINNFQFYNDYNMWFVITGFFPKIIILLLIIIF